MQISKETETEKTADTPFLQGILILSSSGAFRPCLLPGCYTYCTLPTQNTNMQAFSVIWPALMCLGTLAQGWQISPESCRGPSHSGAAAANQLLQVWLPLPHSRQVTLNVCTYRAASHPHRVPGLWLCSTCQGLRQSASRKYKGWSCQDGPSSLGPKGSTSDHTATPLPPLPALQQS